MVRVDHAYGSGTLIDEIRVFRIEEDLEPIRSRITGQTTIAQVHCKEIHIVSVLVLLQYLVGFETTACDCTRWPANARYGPRLLPRRVAAFCAIRGSVSAVRPRAQFGWPVLDRAVLAMRASVAAVRPLAQLGFGPDSSVAIRLSYQGSAAVAIGPAQPYRWRDSNPHWRPS